MALPIFVDGVTILLANSYFGPFKSNGGNIYTAGAILGASTQIGVYKATDPTSSFSEQNSSNRPDISGNIASISCYKNSDNLHIAPQEYNNDDVYYARFDMSSDTWQDVDGTGNTEVLVDGTPNGTADACDIAVLSASYGVGSSHVKIRVVYQGATDMDMGTSYERIDESNSVDDGVNWSAPTSIDGESGGAGVHYTGPRIVKHPSDDQCFIFFSDETNLTQHAIAGDDTLRTYRDTGRDVTGDNYPITHGLGFIRLSIAIIRIGYIDITSNDLEVYEFDAFTDDTDFTAGDSFSVVSTDDVQANNGSIIACLAADGSVIRGLMVKNSDDDLYEFFDDDADNYTLQGTAHVINTISRISCNSYDRSGPKLAMVYWVFGGGMYYDEISLGAPPVVDLPLGTLALLGVGI